MCTKTIVYTALPDDYSANYLSAQAAMEYHPYTRNTKLPKLVVKQMKAYLVIMVWKEFFQPGNG